MDHEWVDYVMTQVLKLACKDDYMILARIRVALDDALMQYEDIKDELLRLKMDDDLSAGDDEIEFLKALAEEE